MKYDLGHEYNYDDTDGAIYLNGGRVFTLKGTKCKIFNELLKRTPGEATSREELINAIWGKDDPLVYGSALTQQIHLLRKELEIIGLKNYIQSQPRKGYFINTSLALIKKKQLKILNTEYLSLAIAIMQLLTIMIIITFHLKI